MMEILLFVLVYSLGSFFMAPAILLSLFGGFYFGWPKGAWVVLLASNVAAISNYFGYRYLFYRQARKLIDKHNAAKYIEKEISKNQFWILFTLRFTPIVPFSALNAIVSQLNVSFTIFVVTTLLAKIPVSTAYAYLGSLASSLEDLYRPGQLDNLNIILTFKIIGAVSSIVLIVLGLKMYKRANQI